MAQLTQATYPMSPIPMKKIPATTIESSRIARRRTSAFSNQREAKHPRKQNHYSSRPKPSMTVKYSPRNEHLSPRYASRRSFLYTSRKLALNMYIGLYTSKKKNMCLFFLSFNALYKLVLFTLIIISPVCCVVLCALHFFFMLLLAQCREKRDIYTINNPSHDDEHVIMQFNGPHRCCQRL